MADRVAGPTPAPIVLASASPRRTQLLGTAGIDHEAVPADVDEPAVAAGLAPTDAVVAVALAKASDVRSDRHDVTVVGADTMVVLDGVSIGKPADRDDARGTLRRLSGRRVDNLTCVAVIGPDGHTTTDVVTTAIALRPLTAVEIDAYVDTGAADDKAGSLEVQGRAAGFVHHLDGCWTNVVGLPVCRLADLLGLDPTGSPCPGPAPAGSHLGCAWPR